MRLDEQIDKVFMMRERKRGLEAQLKKVKVQIEAASADLLVQLDKVGTTIGRGSFASASVTETTVPTIEDWGLVEQYVLDNDAVYLLHRRVSSGPWKELQDAGTDVPGIRPFTKRAISLRKLSD
jgi:hypothetical protein